MSSFTLGILGGFIAGLMQSCAYLCGRRFLAKGGNATELLFCSLVITGIATWVLAPFVLQTENLFSWRMLGYVAMTDIGLIVGHWGFFSAQKYIESSRIASLMGLKILVVALLAIVLLREKFTLLQYIAMLGAAGAGILMNSSSGKLQWGGMGYLALTLVGYAFSDLGIQLVVKEINVSDPIIGGLSGFVTNYAPVGVIALFCLKPMKIDRKKFFAAAPQGICWIFSMLGLYVCFGLMGAAFGNVLQASRGIISLIIGAFLSYFAIQNFDEQKQSAAVWIRKGLAALLMFGAIVLYAVTKR